jgi:2,4-dienoyl-CoA reductase-like NADH-dependent reductase (Old Yellow Enzyme family)
MSLAAAFTPLVLGPLQLPNRFIKAGTYEGMTLLAGAHQPATAALAAHHAGIACGGAALTTLGYVAVATCF